MSKQKDSNNSKIISKNIWHTLSTPQLLEKLSTSAQQGLSSQEARQRLASFGKNELEEKKGRSPFKIFLSQFNDFMIWILIAAAFISGVIVREITDAIVILIILVINSVLGFVQEYRAEKALQALKELASPTAKVIRDGQELQVNSNLLVPGDIVKLTAGDLVPADCRVLEQVNLQTNEAPITGESMPVDKINTALDNPQLGIGDRINLLFSGTVITRGRGRAVIVETGKNTEIGKIASMVQQEEELTPLQKELKTVGKKIGIICIVISVIVFGSGLLKGNPLGEMLLVAVALAVAAIPEGLPAIVTVSLALGVQKMAKNNALIRKLSSVETLGGVTVICTDKTGTLTINKMMVRKIFTGLNEDKPYSDYISQQDKSSLKPSGQGLNYLLQAALLCNDAYYIDEQKGTVSGDPTETALLELGQSYSLSKSDLEQKMPRIAEEPFDSERKMMTTVHQDQKEHLLFSKGAPEVILSRCSRIIKEGQVTPLTDQDRQNIANNHTGLAKNAMRTLAFAFKALDQIPSAKEVGRLEQDLIYCGSIGMIDPPRPEAAAAIKQCKRANIGVIMVTGDHKLTAQAIGTELGLLDEGDLVLDGQELDALSAEELQQQIENIKIFARVSPANKVAIVDALKKNQHIVAMTGDGINDAPSLKKADIGVAMGITGTDVSKESSEMILTDDNFATIVKAIRQGRIIYDNLKKFILFLLSCNISEVLLMFIAIVFGDYIFYLILGERGFLYIPLLPVQILWMNLITDGLPAMALGVDPPEANIMERKAQKNKEQILSPRRLGIVSWQGLVLTFGALFVFFAGPVIFPHNTQHDIDIFHTSVFTTLVLSQLFHTFNFRFQNRGIFTKDIFANKYLNLAIIASILLQAAIIYIPWLQDIFNTTALSLNHWLLIVISSLVPVIIINFINQIRYKTSGKGD
ncbi:MAG: calcium-translocating P-type ATPase, PMCA-type [Actinomycetota bacterium]|nr:calcium-translocating P-type ATPase, PMCA-type [Actinomycetota bacterium]